MLREFQNIRHQTPKVTYLEECRFEKDKSYTNWMVGGKATHVGYVNG